MLPKHVSFFSSIDPYQSWKKAWRVADLHQEKLVGLLDSKEGFPRVI